MANRPGPSALDLAPSALVWLFALAAARVEATQPAVDALTRAIAGLKSKEFAIRQLATRQLDDAGAQSAPLLAEAVKSNDKEVRSRAIGILLAHATSKEPRRREAARAALAELSASSNRTAAEAAAAALVSARDGGAALAM